jgi:hypothetical protein
MKNLIITTIALLITIISYSQFNQDNDTFVSGWVDPTFTDKGAQFGATWIDEQNWGYLEVSASTYRELEPSYTDVVFGAGLAFQFKDFTAHLGGRAGVEFRAGGAYNIFGGQTRFLYAVTDRIHLGINLWLDWRHSQNEQFWGNGDMFKENAAFMIAIRLGE